MSQFIEADNLKQIAKNHLSLVITQDLGDLEILSWPDWLLEILHIFLCLICILTTSS